MTTLRQMGAKIGSRVRFIEDPEGQWRTVKTDAELDYEHLLPWVVENRTMSEPIGTDERLNRIEELEAKLAKAVGVLEQISNCQSYRLPSPQDIARATLAELKGQGDA